MALSDSDKIRLIEDHYRSFCEGDLEDFDHQLSPDFVDAGTAPGLPGGVEGARAWARTCRRASPDMRVVVTDALVAGDVVAVRAAWRGTQIDQPQTQLPAGDQMELARIVVWELDEQGRIVRRTGFGEGPTALVEATDRGARPSPPARTRQGR